MRITEHARRRDQRCNVEVQVSRARKDMVTDFRAKAEPMESAKPEKRGFLRRLLTRQ